MSTLDERLAQVRQLYDAQAYPDALDVLLELKNTGVEDRRVDYAIAATQYQLGNERAAQVAYQSILRREPDSAEAARMLARMAMARALRGKGSPQVEKDDSSHSGRLLLRMAPSLHGELARAAERDGVSLNAYITGVLGRAADGRPPGGPAAPGEGRLIRIAVMADLVLVAVAAVVAIALLVVAWP